METKNGTVHLELPSSYSHIPENPAYSPLEMLPPPYTDDPPAYSEVADNSPSPAFSVFQPYPDYMTKLPYGDTNTLQLNPLPPLDSNPFPRSSLSPQEYSVVSECHSSGSSPLDSTMAHSENTSHQPPTASRPAELLSPTTSASYKSLLQPTPTRIVETITKGRRKTKSVVKDLETGKEYVVKEKTSRNGRRSKAVIAEVGGPKTYVKETPKRTVICQKKE